MLHAWLQAASEDELRYALGLSSYTTGKGKVDMKDTHMRPIEVFMCSVVSEPCVERPFCPFLDACLCYSQELLQHPMACRKAEVLFADRRCFASAGASHGLRRWVPLGCAVHQVSVERPARWWTCTEFNFSTAGFSLT